jgi:hypothetical protein
MQIVSPIGEWEAPETPNIERPTSLKNVAVLANGWPAMKTMADFIQTRLRDEYGYTPASFSYETTHATDSAELDRAAEMADFAIAGAAT